MIEKITNKNFYEKNKNIFREISIFDIPCLLDKMYKNNCLRKAFFYLKKFSRSDFTIYNIEKTLEEKLLLGFLRKKYLKYSNLNFLDEDKQELVICGLRFDKSDFLIGDKNILIFKIIKNVSDFKRLDSLPLIEDFPLLLYLSNNYKGKNICIIYKNLYGKNEVSHTIKIVDSILYINENQIDLEYEEIALSFFKAIETLTIHDMHNSIPDRQEDNWCKSCNWNSFCKYI